ncbi:UNVERIFIED_CONTAM: hypothetical protein NCL1_08991 [Trichonephila clavipes]
MYKSTCIQTKCFGGRCKLYEDREECHCPLGHRLENGTCLMKCSHRHCIGGECRVVRGNVEECVCPLGFILIGGICTITNCTPRRCYGGRCESREDQLVCICPDGFHLEGVGCIETQCKEQNCFGGHCRVVKGEEICTCLDNYVLKDNQCQKIRCVERSCFGGKCDVVEGEEVCSCPVGFEPHGDVCRGRNSSPDFFAKLRFSFSFSSFVNFLCLHFMKWLGKVRYSFLIQFFLLLSYAIEFFCYIIVAFCFLD